jgi:cytochrome c oxidase cbb3-type subunit 3
MSTFWSVWIIVITVFTFVATFWLLFANRKEETDKETTGDVYDGIEEYNNPLPAWWLWMFVITLVFGLGYLLAYPGFGNFQGLLGWSQISQYEEEVEAARERYEPLFEAYLEVPVPELAQDERALRMGQRLFANNCAQCHGSDAGGAYGFPSLADGAWLYGGSPEQIVTSIANGRQGVMPPWEAALSDEQIADVTSYVRSMSGLEDAAEGGQQVFGMFCAACHGAGGTGNQMLGAPDLTDGIWLYSSDAEEISAIVRNGRSGLMPAHSDLLSESRIHILAAYVYSLSNSQDE